MPVLGRNIHLTYQAVRAELVLKFKPLASTCEVCKSRIAAARCSSSSLAVLKKVARAGVSVAHAHLWSVQTLFRLKNVGKE